MRSSRQAVPIAFAIVFVCNCARAELVPRLVTAWKEGDARGVAFSPDGRSLVSFGDGAYRLRDTETGRVKAVLAASPDGLSGPWFSPDGRLLFGKVSSSRYKPLHVFDLKVWIAASGELDATFPYVSDSVNAST